MKQGPNVTKALEAWGDKAPEWVIILAEACDQGSQSSIGRKLGYASTVISQAINNSYGGNLNAVQKAVEGAFCNAEVDCPAMGPIPTTKCVTEQRRPFGTANGQRVRIWRACRGLLPRQNGKPCPHFYGKRD